LLIIFAGKSNKPVAARLPCLLVCHDFCRLARREASLEEGDKDKFINFMSQIADENGIFRATIIATIDESPTRSPVKAEYSVGVWDRSSV
jgi:hypothetical protein